MSSLRPLLVTGCARSGTAYASAVLEGIGLDVGHEAVFGPRTRRFEGFGETHGDSSWLAVPFLDILPEDTYVLHQTRHPQAAPRGLLGVAGGRLLARADHRDLVGRPRHGDHAMARVESRG